MDIKNMKVSIGIVIAIIAQAFGIIWYVAQLDSTVNSLDSSVAQMQEQATTVDVAVLQTDLENIKEKLEIMDEMHSEKFDPTDLEEAIDELDEALDALDKRSGIIENEMRTIMSDHDGFNDALKELGLSGYSDKRQYGNYGGQ